jgi:hypothetical protein
MIAVRSAKSEWALRLLLRYIGSASLVAVVAVFMPRTWMDATHQWLGMGPLPSGPVVGYLARSLSLFYALMGGLLWLVSMNPQRHRTVLLYLSVVFILFGVIILGVDFNEGLPASWKCVEGPMVIGFGCVMLWLTTRLQPQP